MRGMVDGVWRCSCKKLWIFRTGWWFGDFPPTFQRTVPGWHRARWWEKLRWIGARKILKIEVDSDELLG
jgi:hypothetical protein